MSTSQARQKPRLGTAWKPTGQADIETVIARSEISDRKVAALETAPAALSRPVMRYHGGKWRLAPWVISHFPPHRTYVEPFGGAGSVLMRKPRSYAEVYNDRWRGAVNVFEILRDTASATELCRRLMLTPFARDEYAGIDEETYDATQDPIERARLLIFRSFAGFGSDAQNLSRKTGFRANSNRSNTTPAHDWANYPSTLSAFTSRLRGVVIENRPAIDVMRQHDGYETLHYVDPPYPHSTRTSNEKRYAFEMTDEEHVDLAAALRQLEGMVIVSGYACDLYDRLFAGWECVQTAALADGALDRIECLWINQRAAVRSMPPLLAAMQREAPAAPRNVAALYVETGGCYFGAAAVEAWDEVKDARKYEGSHPVVAHPPCQRWGRFWHGSTRKPHQFKLGDDGGCFAAALAAVRRCGGVLEHPADSRAWDHFGLNKPKRGEGWVRADDVGGWTCYVEQGHYGHLARKGTWLYAAHVDRPELKWTCLEQRLHPTALERYGYAKARRIGMMAMVGGKRKTEIRNATPVEFRDVLISIARTASPPP